MTLNQNSIKFLSLTTDPTCFRSCDEDALIDLSSFHQLQSLCWRAPTSGNLDTISVAIGLNLAQLQTLELDFVNWPSLAFNLDYDSADERDHGSDGNGPEESYFTRKILHLDRRSLQPCLENIRTLSLSHVPLGAAMAQAINFGTLESLSLRLCPNWDTFLQRVLSLKLPVRLRKLELQSSRGDRFGVGEFVVHRFLDAFDGLEELAISSGGPHATIELWSHVANHRATLRSFAHHQRTIDSNNPHSASEIDLSDLAIVGSAMCKIKEHPSENPLAQLDLEFIGLSCVPERLVPL